MKHFRPGPPRKQQPPVVKIKVALIDPWKKEVTLETVVMHPAAIQDILGKKSIAWAKIAVAKGLDVMFAGDRLPQVTLLAGVEAEPEYTVSDEFGTLGPVCHGKGMIFGFAVAAKKACSIPVSREWVLERVTWGGDGA